VVHLCSATIDRHSLVWIIATAAYLLLARLGGKLMVHRMRGLVMERVSPQVERRSAEAKLASVRPEIPRPAAFSSQAAESSRDGIRADDLDVVISR
jgi:uncharacterized membrane protein